MDWFSLLGSGGPFGVSSPDLLLFVLGGERLGGTEWCRASGTCGRFMPILLGLWTFISAFWPCSLVVWDRLVALGADFSVLSGAETCFSPLCQEAWNLLFWSGNFQASFFLTFGRSWL